jgi:hypothetical protein
MRKSRAYLTSYLPRCATAANLAAVAIMMVVNACGGGDDNLTDSGSDATTDGPGQDAAKDSSTEAGKDAGVDAADASNDVNDAGSDATDDVTDAGADVANDTSSEASTDAGIDVTVTCGSFLGYGFVSVGDAGGCGEGEDYMCGTDSYQIECDCPSATCTCEKNGTPIGSMPSYAGCPSCSITPSFSTLATACGIPY